VCSSMRERGDSISPSRMRCQGKSTRPSVPSHTNVFEDARTSTARATYQLLLRDRLLKAQQMHAQRVRPAALDVAEPSRLEPSAIRIRAACSLSQGLRPSDFFNVISMKERP
jgi:hypothetical protein